MIRRTVLLNHFHVVTPTTVNVKTDTSTVCFARELCVPIRSEELEACQLQCRFQYQSTSHISVKHIMEDEEKCTSAQALLRCFTTCTKVSNNSTDMRNVGNKYTGVLSLMFISSSLVKELTTKKLVYKQNNTHQHTEAAIRYAMLASLGVVTFP